MNPFPSRLHAPPMPLHSAAAPCTTPMQRLRPIGLAALLGGRAYGRTKNKPFESGVDSVGSARLRFSAKFYLVAMLFVIFDVEALYLFAWAVSVRESGWAGLIEATVFIAILLAGLVYLWRIGALDWAPQGRRERQAKLKQ